MTSCMSIIKLYESKHFLCCASNKCIHCMSPRRLKTLVLKTANCFLRIKLRGTEQKLMTLQNYDTHYTSISPEMSFDTICLTYH